ncbi:MAG: tetratricopeptide repeat-containing sensor histidine kinase [Reichenbachiella sp.]|uniref:tetratricopeptide repeat-containing sensor histidine kinase n=1 Tax=Reichenbachiella sp. TaxID=2184521 RepID=UPI00326593D4
MAYLIVIGLFFSFKSIGQNNSAQDSLIHLIETSNSLDDSSLFELLIEVTKNHHSPSTRIKYARQARDLGEKNNNQLWLRKSYLGLGYAFKLDGELELALESHLKALDFAIQMEDQSLEATSYNAIAGVYRLQENYSLSLDYYRKSIDIFNEFKDTLRLATTLMNAGELFRFKKEYDSAIAFTKISKQHFTQLGHTFGMAYSLGNIGLIYAETGRIDSAENYMSKAIGIFNSSGKTYPISVYQISLADIYTQRKDYGRALSYAHSALEIGQQEGLKEQIRDASLKLSQLYQNQGNYRKAYDYQSQYIIYRDSINNDETIRKMADLRTEYQVSRKQAEVDLKQTEVDLLNEQARNNQIVLWSVIVILVLVLFLTYALLKIYRVKVRAIRIVRKRRKIITAQRDQLEEVNKTKDKFFSIISHDIRGPISNFQGVSQLIHLLVESNDKDALLKLGTMLDTSSKEVSALLDNLLEWAMSQQGRMPYKPEEIKLHELCNSNLAIMKNLATAKQITINDKVKEKVSIRADKNSVSTIIRNLISNAIKFTPEGGKVKLTLGFDVNMAVISIKDTGIGIPKEKMPHLFDFKGERSRWGTDGEKGVGLGLTLVHEFVELNNGRIEVKSEEGKGTMFMVYLPLISE